MRLALPPFVVLWALAAVASAPAADAGRLLADWLQRPAVSSAPRLSDPAVQVAATYYYACRSLAESSPRPCQEPSRFPAAERVSADCSRLYREALFMREPSGSPRSEPLCEAMERQIGDLARPAEIPTLCRQRLRGSEDAGSLCSSLLPAGADARHVATCAAKVRLYRGEAQDCRDFSGSSWNQLDAPLCRAVLARRRGDQAACAADPFCSALARTPADCDRYARQALSALRSAAYTDVIPQPASFPYRAKAPKALYLPATSAGKDGTAPATGPDNYAYLQDGVIEPPRAYHAQERYTPADMDRIHRGLVTARRYADINNAFSDGYRLEDKFDPGMGIHMHNLGLIMAGKVEIEKPEFLTYTFNRSTRRFQLMQMGYIQRGHEDGKPYKLFDTPEAHGHFHHMNICVRVEDNLIVDAQDESCSAPGDVDVGPMWMMHFAVNIFNEKGMFADYFSYADRLSSEALTYTFYGSPVTH